MPPGRVGSVRETRQQAGREGNRDDNGGYDQGGYDDGGGWDGGDFGGGDF